MGGTKIALGNASAELVVPCMQKPIGFFPSAFEGWITVMFGAMSGAAWRHL